MTAYKVESIEQFLVGEQSVPDDRAKVCAMNKDKAWLCGISCCISIDKGAIFGEGHCKRKCAGLEARGQDTSSERRLTYSQRLLINIETNCAYNMCYDSMVHRSASCVHPCTDQ